MSDAIRRTAALVAVVIVTLGTFSDGALADDPRPDLGTPIGFGRDTTGGGAAAVAWVTSLADSGPGTLRDLAGRRDPLVIQFRVSGVIALSSNVEVGPDKTIDGRGADITVAKKGLEILGSNVIIENLRFADLRVPDTQDAIEISGASRIWIDHCSFTGASDKAIALLTGTDVTISWNRFHEQEQVIQLGTYSTRADGSDIRVTVHNNIFDNTGYRNPRISYGWVHAFNNLVRNWGTHGMSSVRGARLLSERNVFVAGDDKNAVIPSAGKRVKDHEKGFVRSSEDLLVNGAKVKQREPELVFDPHEVYRYSSAVASMELAHTLETTSGWQALTDPPTGTAATSVPPPGSSPPSTAVTATSPAPVASSSTSAAAAAPVADGPRPEVAASEPAEDTTPAVLAAACALLAVSIGMIGVLRRRHPRRPPTT